MSNDKVKAKYIHLDRAEGPSYWLPQNVTLGEYAGNDVWERANLWLIGEAVNAPKTGGYDKVDFTITFEDGESYSGTYGLKHINMEQPNLKRHVRNFVDFIVNDEIVHFRAYHEKNGTVETFTHLARTYDVGVQVKEEV